MRKTWTIFALVAGLLSASPDAYAQEAAVCVCNLSGAPAAPPPDSLRLGVILVQFSDWATNTDARGSVCQFHQAPNNIDHYTYQMFYDQFFGTNYRTAPPYGKKTHDDEELFGSMQEFFQEMSYGKFKLRTNSDIINPHPNPNAPPQWVTLRQTKSWWHGTGPQQILDSTLAVSGFNISGYDKIAVIHAGREGDIGPIAIKNGLVYLAAEKGNSARGRTQTPGAFYGIGINCHEFGHLLDLPDLKIASAPWTGGHREFALMSTGNNGFMDGSASNSTIGGYHAPTPLEGWSKLTLGWATYEEINTDGPITFPAFDATDRVCVGFINDTNHADWEEGEYFVIENRRPQLTSGKRTFDGDLVNGLLIWHHANTTFTETQLKMDVKEANGINEAGNGIASCKNAHLFPGTTNNTAFTPYTTPNTNKKDGTRSGLALTCIKVNGSGASAYVTANAYLNFYTGSWSGNVTTNTAWGGTVTVNTNVTVNNGVTLTIDPGAVIQFASGTSLTVNGKLVADSNDPTKRITFTGTTATSGFWNGIIINSGSSTNVSTLRRCDVQYATTGVTINYTGNTNNVTLDKCKIQNNSSNGIYVAGNGSGATVHPTISNSTIANNGNDGIYLTNYAKPTITVNRIENNGYAGIETASNNSDTVSYNYIAGNLDFGVRFTFSSSAFFHHNTVKSNYGKGVYCGSTSNLTAYGTDNTKGRNEIILNSGVGIYSSSSSPTFGISPNGHNVIYDNGVYQAQQAGTGQLRAESCWWNGDQSQISGNVDLTPYLTSAPSPPTGWGNSDTYDPTLRMWRGDEDSLTVLLSLADISSVMQKSSTPLQVSTMSNGIIDWSGDLQAAIDEGRKTGDWSAASEVITNLHRELQNARLPNLDFTLVNNYANDLTVAAFIRKMLALVLMEKDLNDSNVAAALTKATNFSRNNADYTAELLANSGLIYLYRQNDLTAAKNVLGQLESLAQRGAATPMPSKLRLHSIGCCAIISRRCRLQIRICNDWRALRQLHQQFRRCCD